MTKGNLCVCIIGPHVIGPFPSLTAAHRWGQSYTGVTYKLLSSPDGYDNDTLVEAVLREGGRLFTNTLIDGTTMREDVKRCPTCESVLSPEPALEEWGFCTSECEREWNETHR